MTKDSMQMQTPYFSVVEGFRITTRESSAIQLPR